MKKKSILLFILALLAFNPVQIISQVSFPRTGAVDYYRVKSAMLPRKKTFDFRFSTQMESTDYWFNVPVNQIDTLRITGSSMLANLKWMLSYAMTANSAVTVSGIGYYDKNADVFRYGAGDTRFGIQYTYPNVETEFNWGFEAFYSIPTGFDQGDRLVRAFASEKGGWGSSFYVDFNWRNYTARVNGTYFHAGGRVESITHPLSTFWYNTLDGIYGITPTGQAVQSSQASVGVGLSRTLPFGTRFFAEYYSFNVFARQGEGKSLGNATFGMSVYSRPGIDIKLGYDQPLGNVRPNPGFFMDLRLNGVIGGRRVLVPAIPVASEEEPSLQPGRKPFFRREGVVYSRVREPIRDTIFIIDATPSMVGRGLVEGNRGEEVARNIIDFAQTLIDSLRDNSNVSLITFNDEVSSISWRAVDTSKKEEIKNAIRDIPDNINTKADELDAISATNQWKEMLEEAIVRGYQELASFKRSDYNKIHLQRLIIFSDGIDESTVQHDFRGGFNSIVRRYQLNRDDFRYVYYLHTNPRSEGARVDENIQSFVEKENGKVFRSLDIANVEDTFIDELRFNGIENRPSLRYESQITRIAVVDFNTKGLGNVRQPLIDAFNQVFDYNEYFVVKPQAEVQAVVANERRRQDKVPNLRELVSIGRRLGVDYVIYGEILDYRVDRNKGIHIPYLFGLPKTEMSIDVAIRLIDVAEGSLEYVNTISSSSGKRDGFMFFPRGKENKMNQLSGIELTNLQQKLLLRWADRLQENMFEDRSIILP